MLLKLVSSDGTSKKVSFEKNSVFEELVSTIISLAPEIFHDNLEILCGYPPKLLENVQLKEPLSGRGIRSGDVIYFRRGSSPSLLRKSQEGNGGSPLNLMEGKAIQLLVRRVIDPDNSCLFNSIGLLIGMPGESRSLRSICAESVISDPSLYTSDILGKSPEDYAAWILDIEKWGGEIEMNILSNFFNIEIGAVDIQTGKIYFYGSGNSSRVYLLYDGIHYDAIVKKFR